MCLVGNIVFFGVMEDEKPNMIAFSCTVSDLVIFPLILGWQALQGSEKSVVKKFVHMRTFQVFYIRMTASLRNSLSVRAIST